MTLGNKIAHYRRQCGITQEALARQLDVTNQAVSKWESDQCCPDIALLPKLADIFRISLDELFDRDFAKATPASELPWEDDGTLRAVVYIGRKLIAGQTACEDMTFHYEGPALNVSSAFSLCCDAVGGSVTAGGDVECGNVSGSVTADGDVSCDNVGGNVSAGGDISCDRVGGNVTAGEDVDCDEIRGSVKAGGDVTCDSIGGSAVAGGSFQIG